jgi:prevent-host-death family protein
MLSLKMYSNWDSYGGKSMLKDIPITEARHELTSLPERLAKEPGAVAVTRRGKPVLAVMPWELYQSIAETLEIMGDEDLMAALRKSVKEAEEGKVIPWERVKKDLGL